MTVTENFEARLMELDPRDDEFVLSVDTLRECQDFCVAEVI